MTLISKIWDFPKSVVFLLEFWKIIIGIFFQISACGCNATDPRYVAFISGDNLCRLAKTFLCHVFYTSDVNVARDIVHHMANGFERTLTTA